MNRNEQFLKELNKESTATRKMLSVVPNDQFDWKPHPKSMSIRQLASHIAELPSWVNLVLDTHELDFAQGYMPSETNDTDSLLAVYDKNLAAAQVALQDVDDARFDETWTLRNADHILSKDPKEDVIRMVFSQIIHHRAQLGVFLRLLDIPIPGSYGPSADEGNF